MKARPSLYNREFLILNIVTFLVFINIAVFFQFQSYLSQSLHLSQKGIGFLIGVFALTALVIRPVISPLLHPDNARRWIFIGSAGVVACLLLYTLPHGFGGMAVVRVLHGVFYVVMASAVMALFVAVIPRERSAEAFGVFSVMSLLPYAVIPPLLTPLSRRMGGFIPVLNMTGGVMLLIFPLLLFLKRLKGREEMAGGRITLSELAENLRNRRIVILFGASLLVFAAFAPVFYFLKGYARHIGIANAGWFFTVSTVVEILVRLVGGRFMDRGNKVKILAVSLLLLLTGYLILARTTYAALFYGLAVVFGLGWGIALPIFNGLTFDFSPPRLRPLNANLGLEMFQGGLFLGPFLGGMVLDKGSYGTLFTLAGATVFLAFLMILCIKDKPKEG